nr:hypothetical protein [uncultured Mediterranean phage uvMED]
MELRKLALWEGDMEMATKLFKAAMDLDVAGLVTEEERLAAAYL